MPQGVLPFQYVEEQKSSGMTALAGLPLYLELAEVAGLPESIRQHLGLREHGQGWTDTQIVMALVLLNLAGGEAVEDLGVLEGDAGFCAVLRKVESHGHGRRQRRVLESRWRKEQRRSVPSISPVFRYLALFHDPEEEKKREPHRAFIPAATAGLQGLRRVNAGLVGFVQRRAPEKTATLDMDATLIETEKRDALYGYKGFKAYQPLTTYWAEQGLAVGSEFRDGNVPAGHQQKRVLEEVMDLLPQGIAQVRLRSDTAAYQEELLTYCAEGKHPRFGVIPFVIGVDVTPEFKRAVVETPEETWHPLPREVAGEQLPSEQEWAEVCFVPNWIGHKKSSADYRFVAIREPLRQEVLAGMAEQLPFPTAEFHQRRYKVHGIVTNRDLPGEEIIAWYRGRCGKSEEAHAVMKNDLAGGKLPSGDFGENAAWWGIMLLAFNLQRAMQRLALGAGWWAKRLKALRFGLISIPGRVVQHAGSLLVQIRASHPSYQTLLQVRRSILGLALAPPS